MDPFLATLIDKITDGKAVRYVFPRIPNKWPLMRRAIAEIAERYAKSDIITDQYKKEYYAKGYKQGYVDRSDEIYDQEMISRYQEFVGKYEIPEDD